MNVRAMLVAGVLVMSCAGSVLAVPAGKTIEWTPNMGKVVFKGDDHAGKGMKCTECHPKIFPMKKGDVVIGMAAINDGQFCGVCHNGKRAFNTTNCGKCHKSS